MPPKDAARKTEEDCGDPAAPAVGEFPTLQAALKQRGPVQPQIKQKGSRGDDPSEKQGTRCPCGSFQLAGGFNHRTMRLKQKQPERGDDGCACQIEEPLERIDPKQVRDGQFFLARQEKWAHRFASAAEKENGREASERHGVNRPEVRGPQVSLEHFPAQRTQRVTGVDSDNRKDQKEGVSIANCDPKSCPAEITEMHHPAGPINRVSECEQDNQDDKKLPRR